MAGTEDGGATSALAGYLDGLDPETAAAVRVLHEAVVATHPAFDVAVKYRMLTYAIGADWRRWVCAIDAHPRKGIGLRFLYGVLLPDPRHVLRGGTSVLMTWDLAPGEPVDRAAVGEYVREAVARYPDYRADTARILEESRATAPGQRMGSRSRPADPGS
jgi:hypothetical protein